MSPCPMYLGLVPPVGLQLLGEDAGLRRHMLDVDGRDGLGHLL